MSSIALLVVLLLFVVFSIALSVILLFVQLDNERERMEWEARATKARRLRTKIGKTEVVVPSIPKGMPKHFHLFLSHVWGYGCTVTNCSSCCHADPWIQDLCRTGQDQMRIVKQRLKEIMPYIEVFLDVRSEA
jgi:hypothetical protein